MTAPQFNQLSREFAQAIAASIDRPAMLADRKRKVCWRDQLGYVQWAELGIYHEGGTRTFDPDGKGWRAFKSPWIVRIHINHYSLRELAKACIALRAAEYPRDYCRQFEYSMYPGQVLKLVPWVVAFSHGLETWHTAGYPDDMRLPKPPIPSDFWTSGRHCFGCTYTWTKDANKAITEYLALRRASDERRKARLLEVRRAQ